MQVQLCRDPSKFVLDKNVEMKIAFPTNDGVTIASHFRRSCEFKIFDIEGRRILKTELRPTGFLYSSSSNAYQRSSREHHEIQKEIIDVIDDCDRVVVTKIRKRHLSMLVAHNTMVDTTMERDINKAIQYYLEDKSNPKTAFTSH